MRYLTSVLMLVVASAAASVVAVAAPAQAAWPITVDSPNGVSVASGSEVVVSGYNGSDRVVTLYVECGQSWNYVNVDLGSFSVSAGMVTGPDTCTISSDYDFETLATFTVAGPTTRVSDASVSSTTFHPVVRDRYQDSVVFRWRQDHDGRAAITVVNADGRTVRSVAPFGSRGRNSWTWNGKKDNGAYVGAGRYRIMVSANSNSVSAPVTARTQLVTKTFRQRKEGNQAASFATRGSCYAQRDSYDQVASLDCWGGSLAKANYRIAIPAAAFDVSGTIDLLRTDADICCRGSIRKGWTRATKRGVVFWASVSQWRATEVNFVRVTYKQKVRI